MTINVVSVAPSEFFCRGLFLFMNYRFICILSLECKKQILADMCSLAGNTIKQHQVTTLKNKTLDHNLRPKSNTQSCKLFEARVALVNKRFSPPCSKVYPLLSNFTHCSKVHPFLEKDKEIITNWEDIIFILIYVISKNLRSSTEEHENDNNQNNNHWLLTDWQIVIHVDYD